MEKFKDSPPHRAFVVTREAWYADALLATDPEFSDEVMIGDYPEEGGTSGEFCIRFVLLGGRMVPRLEAYDDSWAMLAYCHDLIDALAHWDDEKMTVQNLVTVLKNLGFADVTKREKP